MDKDSNRAVMVFAIIFYAALWSLVGYESKQPVYIPHNVCETQHYA